jgi:hypothetical protein
MTDTINEILSRIYQLQKDACNDTSTEAVLWLGDRFGRALIIAERG